MSRVARACLISGGLVSLSMIGAWVYRLPADERPPVQVASIQAPATTAGLALSLAQDEDRDGIVDALEDELAQTFAPVVYHGTDEVAFPVRVDSWLLRTRLSAYDDTDADRTRVIAEGPLDQKALLAAGEGTRARSRMKRRSYFLEDVASESRAGERQPADWVTYVHSYRNGRGGVTLQYWRAYTWNAATAAGLDFSHGGDWEAVSVHLDAALRPSFVSYLQHAGIAYYRAGVRWEGTHPVVYSEEGSHASAPDRRTVASHDLIRQETWTGGQTTWPSGDGGPSGGLLNVGEKSSPRNGQQFIQYAGLWGSPGALFLTSGYWGPAFNETGARCDNGGPAYRFLPGYAAARRSCGRIFVTAWCDEMAATPLDPARECYPAVETR
jgi:hypothetical protein